MRLKRINITKMCLLTMTAIKKSKMRMKQRQNVLKKRIKWVLQNCDIHHIVTTSSIPTVLDEIHNDRLDLSPHSMTLPYSGSYDQNTKGEEANNIRQNAICRI
eukprot:901082_1